MSSNKTYRVQGIPATYNKEESRILLASILEGDNENPEPTVHSLGADPSSTEGNRFQIATVTFKQDPKGLQDNKGEWPLPTTRSRALNDKERVSSITVDSHFLGFTPLNSFEDDSNHKIE
jgi:hypothetical protein